MIEIREATVEDLAALIELYEQLGDTDSVMSEVTFLPEDIPLIHEIFARLKNYPDYRIYLAQTADLIVGTFALLIMDSVPNGIPSAIVENLVVARAWRRKGMGRQLMQFALELCRSKECYEILLSSGLENEAAHRFYESLGFRKNGYSFSVKSGAPPAATDSNITNAKK